jgi:DDE superfamily endonuclease/Fission yeast centromere protein N-terminal domain/Tc5 transposase DNA-binding domain
MTIQRKKRVRKGLDPFRERRVAYTDEEKKDLRKYAKRHPDLKQNELATWFYERYGKKASQGTISEWLSSKYAFLDSLMFRRRDAASSRKKMSKWPALDRPLFEFQQMMQRKNLPVTGNLLKEAARRLWTELPEYKDLPPPSFSNGYIDGFKLRYRIKRYKKHGEAESAPIEESEPRMEEIRETSKQYPLEDQYNMDETGLLWKLIPDSTLATEQQHGRKLEKNRITLAFACNADGSKKLDPWVVNRHQNPRCFGTKGAGLRGRPLEWRSNPSAWMDTQIMLEYIQWFDRQMRRPTLLLLDNFSAHECAVNTVLESENPPFILQHTRVEFLPANTTSHFQPMDQGIIRTFKAYYRRRWLQFMVDCVYNGKDPLKDVNLSHVVRWLLFAWEEVSQETMSNCWIRSTCLGKKHTVEKKPKDWEDDAHIVSETEQLLEELEKKKVIKGKMSIESILAPLEEVIQDSQGDILEQVVGIYCQEVEPEPEKESTPEIKIMETEVLAMLEKLQLYEEGQEVKNNKLLTEICRYERQVRGRIAEKRPIQQTIDHFWARRQ